MGLVTVMLKDSQDNILGSFESSPPDELLYAAITYFALARNYQETLPDNTPNPESKGNFMIRFMKTFAESEITSYAAKTAAEEARQQVLSNPITL